MLTEHQCAGTADIPFVNGNRSGNTLPRTAPCCATTKISKRTAHSAMSSQDAADSASLGLSAQQSVARHSPSTRRVERAEQRSQQSLPIIKDPKIDINSLKDWIKFAEEHGSKLVHRWAICNQWCSAKTGGMKAHLRSCHPEHAQAMKDAEARLRHRYRLKYKGQCRACGFKPASTQKLTHPAKCPTYFQACVLRYIQNPEARLHVGRSGHEGGLPDVRLPPASPSERCNSARRRPHRTTRRPTPIGLARRRRIGTRANGTGSRQDGETSPFSFLKIPQ